MRGLLDAGELRVLAVASAGRSPSYLEVPTFRDLGYDVEIENMKGWAAPAGTPDEIAAGHHDRFRQAMLTPLWRAFPERAGEVDGHLPGPEFQAAMDRLLDQVRRAARRA